MVTTYYDVFFPKLSLKFNISPIAINIFGLPVYWYGILVCAGFTLGFLYSFRKAKLFKIDKNKFMDIAIFSITASIVGARLYYVLFCSDLDYYLNDPIKILAINEGGLAVYGGIILAVILAFVLCKVKKVSIRKMLDISSFGLLTGQSIGRWGNFFNQEAFGTETDFILGMCSENTKNVPVHPCFLYESVWCALGLIFLENINRRKYIFNGQLFLFYIFWYGLGRFFIEGIRTDSLMLPYTKIRISQLVSLVLVFLSLVTFLFRFFSKKIKNRAH